MVWRNSPSESHFSSSVLSKYLNAELELKLAFTLVRMQTVFLVDLIEIFALTVSAGGISEPPMNSRGFKPSTSLGAAARPPLWTSHLFQNTCVFEKSWPSVESTGFLRGRWLWLGDSVSLCSRGDQILEADSVSLRHAALSEAYAILSECGPGPVSLIISRHPNPKVRRKSVTVSGLFSSGTVIWVLLSEKQKMKKMAFSLYGMYCARCQDCNDASQFCKS